MPIARAMLIACFSVLAWLAVLVAVLLLALAGVQLVRGGAEIQPMNAAFAALFAMAFAAASRWAAYKVETMG